MGSVLIPSLKALVNMGYASSHSLVLFAAWVTIDESIGITPSIATVTSSTTITITATITTTIIATVIISTITINITSVSLTTSSIRVPAPPPPEAHAFLGPVCVNIPLKGRMFLPRGL